MPTNPFENPEYIERFMRELEAIKTAVETSASIVPKRIAELNKDLASFYEQGYSPTASLSHQTSGPSPGASGVDIADALRQALGQISEQTSVVPTRRLDERERESGGYRSGGAVGQRPVVQQIKNWEELVTPSHMQRGYLEMPRSEGGHFTASDLFNYVSDTLISRGAKNLDKAQPDLNRLTQQFDATNDPEQAQAILDQYMATRRRADVQGGIGTVLQRAGHEWVPQVAIARQYAARLGVNVSPGGLEAQGAQLGTSPGQGFGSSLTIPGTDIGFRVPFLNPAARAAMSREFQIQKMRFSAGINGDQARGIFDMLNETGYRSQADISGPAQTHMSARPNFGEMADALKKITKLHPELLNPQTVQLMDKAVRQGAASVKDFTKVINAVPDAAKAAGISFQQLQADMDAAGNTAQQMGGTNFQGQRAAVQFSALTKQPGALLAPLMQNPWVQMNAYQRTGLMPWQQGAMNGYQWGSTITGSMQSMYNILRPGARDHKINLGNGFTQTLSARTVTEQLMGQQTGLDPVTIDKMLKENKTVQARATLGSSTEAWSQAVGRARGNPAELKRLFGHGAGTYGRLTHLMNLAGFDPKEQAEVYNVDKGLLHKKLSGPDAAKLATDRKNKVDEIIRRKGDLLGSDPNQNVLGVIKLDDKAKKKGFYLENKRSAQAGVITVNSPYANGPSPQPGSSYDPTGVYPSASGSGGGGVYGP